MNKPIITTRMLNNITSQYQIQYSLSPDSHNYAILVPPTPETGATMNNPIITILFQTLIKRGWNVLRFNYSTSRFNQQTHKHTKALMDTNYITDWFIQNIIDTQKQFIICGYGSGSLIALEVLMRRPELTGFVVIAPYGQVNTSAFLIPCPHSGLFIHGKYDKLASLEKTQEIVKKLQTHKAHIELKILEDDHFFKKHRKDLLPDLVNEYLTYLEELNFNASQAAMQKAMQAEHPETDNHEQAYEQENYDDYHDLDH